MKVKVPQFLKSSPPARWMFGKGTQAWWVQRSRRRRSASDGPAVWFRFRAYDMVQGDGIPVPSIPDMNGGGVSLNSPAGGTPPIMIEGALPNAQKGVYFDPAVGISRMDFSQSFTATASTIIIVAKATNLSLGDQGLVVCANTALYGVLSGFSDHWGSYVKDTAESGFTLDSVFKVVTLRVNADTSLDMFDMATKVSIPAQAGSFPGRAGSSLGGDPGGSQQFQGYVAELEIYDGALSDADVYAKVAALQSF